MITDKLENLQNYGIVSQKVVDFLLTLNSQTPIGRYEIDETTYANIEVYEPKPIDKCKFEAHKKYIDIQMVLDGVEELDYISINGLQIKEEYDPQRDIMFFENPTKTPDTLILEPLKFAMIYPHEAHRPQMNIHGGKVKKVVVKILV